MTTAWDRWVGTGGILLNAFHEQQACITEVHERLGPYLASPDGTPEGYTVELEPVPRAFMALNRNLFSTLFHSVYFLMGCEETRRRLYGKLIHLYRIWVTSADNLLDREDKIVVPIRMAGRSRIMRQVLAVMASDRVLADLVEEAVAAGVITTDQARRLRGETLRQLLPSAAQEATEEDGIESWPEPEHVHAVIHRLKTGLLFNVAFVAPDIVESAAGLDQRRVLKRALLQFGLGCQLLDDIRDAARDLHEGKHNYVLSWLAHHDPPALSALRDKVRTGDERIYMSVSHAIVPAAERGFRLMAEGLQALGAAGLGYTARQAGEMANMMFTVLDIPELSRA